MIKVAFKFKPACQLLFWFFQDLILGRIMRKEELFFSSLDFYGAIIFRSKADDCLSLVSDFFTMMSIILLKSYAPMIGES